AAPPNLNRGFQQMYNLDFAGAHASFGAYQQAHPEDPMGPVSNAAAYLFSEFDRLHILEADLFTDDHKFDNRAKLTPDPALKTEFDKELAKSTDLANKILAKAPQDKNAMFSQVMANGLRGDYAAMIEKRNLASLTYMKTARGMAEKLLAIDPTCYDAYLAIGVENYLLGSSSAPARRPIKRKVCSGCASPPTRDITWHPSPGCCWRLRRCATKTVRRRARCWR